MQLCKTLVTHNHEIPHFAAVYNVCKLFSISESMRVSVYTYSDYTSPKLAFGDGTNRCALRNAFRDLSHDKWATRLPIVMRESYKKFKKSKANCKVMCKYYYSICKLLK